MNDPHPAAPRSRQRLVDRHETGVAFLVGVWTIGFVVRSRLDQSGRLGEVGNQALLSLLLVVPVMLVAWAALTLADRRFKLGLFRPRRRR